MLDFKAIADAGGWVVAVSVLSTVIAAIMRGGLVAGFVYKREVRRGDRLEQAGARLARRIADLERQLNDRRRRIGWTDAPDH